MIVTEFSVLRRTGTFNVTDSEPRLMMMFSRSFRLTTIVRLDRLVWRTDELCFQQGKLLDVTLGRLADGLFKRCEPDLRAIDRAADLFDFVF